jgi:hypothetical protein
MDEPSPELAPGSPRCGARGCNCEGSPTVFKQKRSIFGRAMQLPPRSSPPCPRRDAGPCEPGAVWASSAITCRIAARRRA